MKHDCVVLKPRKINDETLSSRNQARHVTAGDLDNSTHRKANLRIDSWWKYPARFLNGTCYIYVACTPRDRSRRALQRIQSRVWRSSTAVGTALHENTSTSQSVSQSTSQSISFYLFLRRSFLIPRVFTHRCMVDPGVKQIPPLSFLFDVRPAMSCLLYNTMPDYSGRLIGRMWSHWHYDNRGAFRDCDCFYRWQKQHAD